jgi:hypothetical protein
VLIAVSVVAIAQLQLIGDKTQRVLEMIFADDGVTAALARNGGAAARDPFDRSGL